MSLPRKKKKKKAPHFCYFGCFVGQQEAGTTEGQTSSWSSTHSCSPSVPISVRLWSPPPKKSAFHTHSALKLLLEGKEALKGLKPRADGTQARTGQDKQDGWGKKGEVKGAGGKKTSLRGCWWLKICQCLWRIQGEQSGPFFLSSFFFFTEKLHIWVSFPFIHCLCLLFAFFLLTRVNTFQEGSWV